MTLGRNVLSTPMQWADEGKKLDCAVKHVSWAPPWVRPRSGGGEDKVPLETLLASEPLCYIGENLMVDDAVGYGRIPAVWWTLNQRFNYDYELHRLNVRDRKATARAVCANDAVAKRHCFDLSVTRPMWRRFYMPGVQSCT